MPWPDDDIEDLVKGERPTLLEAEKGNELIKALNALRNITIASGYADEVVYSDDEVAIVYKGREGVTKLGFEVMDIEDDIYTMDFKDGLLVAFFAGTTVSP